VVDYTHYYAIIGDGHVRGKVAPAPLIMDPIAGQTLAYVAASQAPVVNTIVRGATSGAMARVTRVGADIGIPGIDAVTVEIWNANAFRAGETLNFDTGGSATCSTVVVAARWPGTEQFANQQFDATLNTPVPNDGVSDTPYWDREAKLGQSLIVAAGFTGAFDRGDLVTTSGGGAFTVLQSAVGAGGARNLLIMRQSGSISAAQTLTNTTQAGSGTVSSVSADPPTGAWLPLYLQPNLGGLGTGFAKIPQGNGGPSIGPEHWILRKAHEKHVASASANDRGVRLLQHSSFDRTADGVSGGVTVQRVKCTGTFATNWTIGETVSGGAWSGKLVGFNVTNKHLFVTATNGQTLGAVVVTGATSGATATSLGAAFGWQKGSVYWNDMVAEWTAAQAATGALYAGQAARMEGLFLMIWEGELFSFGPNGAPVVAPEVVVTAWLQLFADLRSFHGRPDLPITLFHQDPRSWSTTITIGGYPIAIGLRDALTKVAQQADNVTLTPTTGMQPAQTTALPYTNELIYLRPLDYVELGLRAWRALEFAAVVVPPGNFRQIPVILIAGQSHAVGGIPPDFIQFDRDPDLYPSAAFPGVSSIDPAVFQWNADPNVRAWQNLDVATNGNPFFQQFGFSGLQVALAARMKRRYSNVASQSAEVAFIHLPVNGSSASAAAPGAVTTWDPNGVSAQIVTASMSIAPLAATAQDPALGRITATAGAFASFVTGGAVQISGSALGAIGAGGNNHVGYNLSTIYRKAADNAWIDVKLSQLVPQPFVTETATFTLRHGPIAIMPWADEEIRLAFEKLATEKQRIGVPALIVWWNSEGDLLAVGAYEGALQRVLDHLHEVFGHKVKGQPKTPTVILQQTRRTPWPVSDADIEAAITAQKSVATALTNATTVDTDKLPMESGGVFPRTQRQHNGIHHTPRGQIMAGFLADKAAGTLVGIPPHPEGDAAVDFGATGGGIIEGEGGSGGEDTEGLDVEPSGAALIVETGEGLVAADSYLTLADAENRIAIRGAPAQWTAATGPQKNNWLRLAVSQGLDLLLEPLLQGARRRETQALAIPRRGMVDPRSGYAIGEGVVPDAFRWMQADWAMLLAQGIDPLRTIDPGNAAEAGALAIETTDKLPGGLERHRRYDDGGSRQALPALTRIWLLAAPFLDSHRESRVGLA
jgi:hypothetical protein